MTYQTPCTNLFLLSLKTYVIDLGYSYLLFSDKMSIIVALWSSYSLRSLCLQAVTAFGLGHNVKSA
jgi:hypothetical protein